MPLARPQTIPDVPASTSRPLFAVLFDEQRDPRGPAPQHARREVLELDLFRASRFHSQRARDPCGCPAFVRIRYCSVDPFLRIIRVARVAGPYFCFRYDGRTCLLQCGLRPLTGSPALGGLPCSMLLCPATAQRRTNPCDAKRASFGRMFVPFRVELFVRGCPTRAYQNKLASGSEQTRPERTRRAAAATRPRVLTPS